MAFDWRFNLPGLQQNKDNVLELALHAVDCYQSFNTRQQRE